MKNCTALTILHCCYELLLLHSAADIYNCCEYLYVINFLHVPVYVLTCYCLILKVKLSLNVCKNSQCNYTVVMVNV